MKRYRYVIGGYEGDQLSGVVEALVADAKSGNRTAELAEVCRAILEALRPANGDAEGK
jgi:hypothetical protein